MELGGLWWTNVLNLALPPQSLRPDTRLEHQDPVSHTAQKKREKERKRDRERERERERWREGGREGERKKERESEREKERKKIKLFK